MILGEEKLPYRRRWSMTPFLSPELGKKGKQQKMICIIVSEDGDERYFFPLSFST